jgi:hypothetical protein
LGAFSICRRSRRSMQLSYAPILGYSFDSTKVPKTDSTADSSEILDPLGAIGAGGTEKQTPIDSAAERRSSSNPKRERVTDIVSALAP